MVVDLTVIGDDDLPILVRQRLGASSYVHDAQSDVREADPLSDIETVSIWAPVTDGSRHPSKCVDRYSGRDRACNTSDSAHQASPPECVSITCSTNCGPRWR